MNTDNLPLRRTEAEITGAPVYFLTVHLCVLLGLQQDRKVWLALKQAMHVAQVVEE